MAHNLFLAMYAFKIKKAYSSNLDLIENNDFLSKAYPDKLNKFAEGFVQDIINLIDKKTFKNEQNTHGAILEDKLINNSRRILDILIDGGLTGIQQFIIDESGEKRILTKDDIIGLKFYARIWLPANTKSGYLFIQKYGSLSIKPIFDSIIQTVLREKDFSLAGNRLVATTTKVRQQEFLKHSTIKDIVVVSKESSHATGSFDASCATITLKNIITKNNKTIKEDDITEVLKNHGFTIAARNYEIKATYQNKVGDHKEEKTVLLDSTDETINVIPNVIIPPTCIDIDNYPIFSKMQEFADMEMEQIKREVKI